MKKPRPVNPEAVFEQVEKDRLSGRLSDHFRKNKELVRFFNEFSQMEPDIAEALLILHEDSDASVLSAAKFLLRPAVGLNMKTPYQAIMDGQQQDVLDLVYKIEYGMGL